MSHEVSVGPVARTDAVAALAGHGASPAYGYRCSCGARGGARIAANLGGKARNEALELARTDGIAHQREAARRELDPTPPAAA